METIEVQVTDRKGLKNLERFETGQPLKSALKIAGYPILAICGGIAACGSCHVYISESWMAKTGAVSDNERDLLECLDAYRPDASRLSCQIVLDPLLRGLDVTIAPEG